MASNFPQEIFPFVTGPCLIRATYGSESAKVGFSERTPRLLIRSGWLPYFNDWTGQVLPNDLVWSGREAIIMGDLNARNPAAMEQIQNTPGIPNIADTTGGEWDPSEVGTMMLHESRQVPVEIIFPYAFKAEYNGYPGGYRFFNGIFEGPEDWNILGTQPSKVHVVFRCLPKYDAQAKKMRLFEVITGDEAKGLVYD